MRSEGFVTTSDDVEVWYGLTGPEDAPLIALCDGIGCDGFIWAHLMDHFAHRMRILRWHYRGHGRSGVPESMEALSVERLAADLNEIQVALDLGPGVIAGHSMGVQLSLEYYRLFPDHCTSLVLLCGSYGKPLSTFKGTDIGEQLLPYIRSTVERSPGLSRLLWSKLVPTRLSYFLAQQTEINPQRVQYEDFFPYLEHVGRLEPEVFLGMLTKAADHDAKDVLPTIEVPTLIVAGGLDGFTPGALSQEMLDTIPKAEMFSIPGGTHTAPIEFPEALNAQLERFLVDRGLLPAS